MVDCLLACTKPRIRSPAQYKPGVVVFICNLSTQEVERGTRGLEVKDHPLL